VTARPQTIQIFLPSGDPQGIRIGEITTRIVQVIEVPRSLLGDFFKLPASNQVAVYFLFGESESAAEPSVYIGQTGDLKARLTKHHKEKDFWRRVVVLISGTNSLTQTHALFLEWHCLQKAATAGRYEVLNGNTGIRPHTPAPMEADCQEIFETGRTLLATLGYPLFDPLIIDPDPPGSLFCKTSGVDGRGRYTQEGFVVLKGSIGRTAKERTVADPMVENLRHRLVEAGVLRVERDIVVFLKDYLFGSPSMAAVSLLDRRANGWLEWKNARGKTLDALVRS
jgi:predicted GIY-YIG superfamily endonuclease